MATVYELTQAEYKLAEIIWANNPIPTPELSNIAERELGWKKTSTYTYIKRMVDKGIIKNDNAVVHVIITREELLAGQSHNFIEKTFNGSLPSFIASFIKKEKLTSEQVAEVRRLIDEYERGANNG